MRTSRLLISSLISASIVLMAYGAGFAAAASSRVECGQLVGYTAPDPVAPANGSLQIGSLVPWGVLATATVSPEATTALPNIINSGPTCLALDFDDAGKITSIDLTAEGTITGEVELDSVSGYYLFADRLIVPTGIVDAYPGLAALFTTSYQAGTDLTVTFTLDDTNGQFLGLDGNASFCGTGSVGTGGEGLVGEAVIPAAVLDGADRAALAGAGDREACAAVHAMGTVQPGNDGTIAITTDVVITVAAPAATAGPTARPTARAAVPTAPPTSIGEATPAGGSDHAPIAPVLVIVIAAVATFVGIRRVSSTR